MNHTNEVQEPAHKRARTTSESGNEEIDYIISTILRFLSHQEYQNYNCVENRLIPLLLTQSTTYNKGLEANFLEFDSITLSQAQFLGRVFKDLEYLKIDSASMEKVIIEVTDSEPGFSFN